MKKNFVLLLAVLLCGNVVLAAEDYYIKVKSNVSGSGSDITTTQDSNYNQNIFVRREIVIAPNNHSDPYEITVDGKKYYMVFNKNDGKYTPNDVVGFTDPKEDLFRALRAIESDGDKTKITGKELQKANIRLVLVLSDGKLALKDKSTDFDILNISYIDATTFRYSLNKGDIGSFGYFDAFIKGKDGKLRKIIGHSTFMTEDKLNEMIGI